MIDERTARGFPLPHPQNVAVEDVGRLRDAYTLIDEHITVIEDTTSLDMTTLKKALAKQKIETFLCLWN